MKPRKIRDPVEKIVAQALEDAGIEFVHESENPHTGVLDFYLSEHDVYLEVKAFHTPRIADQMSRHEQVIAVQGYGAAYALAAMLSCKK